MPHQIGLILLLKILQRLGVAQAAMTERWPLKEEKTHISSSYAKILGETNFQSREIPRSGSKAKDGEERKRPKVGNNNGQLPGSKQQVIKKRFWDLSRAQISKQLTHFVETPETENLFPPIFWHN